MDVVRGAGDMIAGMDPVLNADLWVFATLDAPLPDALATIREPEGLSVVLPLGRAEAMGLPTHLPMRWITLRVHSALDGVGLTAAVAETLAAAGISCNVVAGHHHDHLFVPAERAEEAVALLRARVAEERR